MTMICVRCLCEDRPNVEAVATDARCNSVCLEHLVQAWHASQALCLRCGWWVATIGGYCEACAVDIELTEGRWR